MPPDTGPPMTLADMRELGVRSLFVTCSGCHHEADVNMDGQPAHLAVPSFAGRMACSKCGSRAVHVMPAWHTKPNQIPHPR
jgi:hypothetical protein